MNVIAQTKSGDPDNVIFVGAHADSVEAGPGINDDGSGTALVMELARVMSSPDVATDRSIRFVLWNNEESGLNGARAYVRGIWASSLRYRASTDTFHWIGCIQGGQTHVWTAPGGGAAARGGEVTDWEWTGHSPLPTCYYDCGLLIDDDDGQQVERAHPGTSRGAMSLAVPTMTRSCRPPLRS